MPLINIDARELACVLAALRIRQTRPALKGDRAKMIDDIETLGGDIEPLTDEEIDNLCESINCSPDKTPPLAIILEGGIVQSVVSLKPDVFGAVYVIDYDTDGADDVDISMIPQADGSESEGFMRFESVEEATFGFEEAMRRHDADETVATGMTGRLPDDTEADELAARAAGWKIDFDSFWTRKREDGEPEVEECTEGLTHGNEVFMRTAALALAYDHRSTKYHVSIKYRTKNELRQTSEMIRAVSSDAAIGVMRAKYEKKTGVAKIDSITAK